MKFFGSAKIFTVLLLLLPAARPAVLHAPRRNPPVNVPGRPFPTNVPGRPIPTSSIPTSSSPTTTSSPTGPSATTEVQRGQTGTLMVLPTQLAAAGLKQIPGKFVAHVIPLALNDAPDPAHPFIAPRPGDQRGPCPAMNTLANHGYISRNGITTFEEVTNGMMEAFNMELHFAAGLAALNFVTRGNTFVNKISIGGVSPLVPPLPGNIDGPVTGGIAKHGRFEGDASISRADAAIGDNRNFQEKVYDLDLVQLSKFGDNGPDGNNTVLNVKTLVEMEKALFNADQTADRQFSFPARRMFAAYGQAAFLMTVFANGTTNQTTLPILNSFFRNETFPPNWFRAASPITGATNAKISSQIAAAIPTLPGRNNAKGVYIADPAPPAPFNSSLPCAGYFDQAANTPSVLQNTTGIFKQNVDLMTGILFGGASANPGCTQFAPPSGPTGV
ncbi:Cloroperoxidase [Mycena venus]|uniref:Cloroperoxidase n=1 Tax=Mycena venus TaxID=2733690 RepID=A0A8H6XDC1_9AGAR|nr:Cloroperoxidase [Mycena venus]